LRPHKERAEIMRTKITLIGGALMAGIALSWLLGRVEFGFTASSPPAAQAAARGTQRTPQRIISMSPAITEMVFALGQGDRVAGVSQFTCYPPEALKKPQCGGFINPDRERILMLRPDLIIVQGAAEALSDFAGRNGIELLTLRIEDLGSIFGAIMQIGSALGCSARAELLCAQMRLRLARVKAAAEGKRPVSIFLVTGREPGTLNKIQTAGSGGFLNDLIRIAGGRNIFADIPRQYATVSKESLLRREPEVIVELRGEGELSQDEAARIRELWRALAPLPAARNDRIYLIGSTYAMIPGPRVVSLAEKLGDILHAEAPE